MRKNAMLLAASLTLFDFWKHDLSLQAAPQETAPVYPWGDAWAWTRCPGGGVWCPPFNRDHGPKPDPEATVKLWRVVPINDEKGQAQ